MKRMILWAPLVVFVLFMALVASGLINPSEKTIRSQLVGKPLPEFALPPVAEGRPGLSRADFVGRGPKLLNIFASWCLPCAAEAPQLLQLQRVGVTIEAIAIRDKPDDVARFLARWGDPFARIGVSDTSSIQLALGSSGVPETFVIDAKGIIRHQHIGDIRAEDVPALLAALDAAK